MSVRDRLRETHRACWPRSRDVNGSCGRRMPHRAASAGRPTMCSRLVMLLPSGEKDKCTHAHTRTRRGREREILRKNGNERSDVCVHSLCRRLLHCGTQNRRQWLAGPGTYSLHLCLSLPSVFSLSLSLSCCLLSSEGIERERERESVCVCVGLR